MNSIMEEKINILKKLYLSKAVPKSLDSFDWGLVEQSNIYDGKSWIFNRKSVASLGMLFLIILFFGVFALVPENPVINNISGKVFNQNKNPVPSQLPQITPSDNEVIQKPSPTPTITPVPTKADSKSRPEVNQGKKQEDIDNSNGNNSSNSNSEDDNDEISQQDVKGVSDEHRQDGQKKENKSSNSGRSSNNSKKD